jgi:hypothetical protein
MTLVLILGCDWGLPSKKRLDLLLAGTPVTPQLLEELDATATDYFRERDRADQRALAELEEGQVPKPYRVDAPDAVFTPAQRFRAFRRFVISSGAIDEREPYIVLGRMDRAGFDFDPHGFIYGGAYLYPVGAILFAQQSLGLFHPKEGIGRFIEHPEELRNMYLAGRSLNLLGFLGVMVVLAMLGRRLGNPRLGTLAMIAWGLSTLPLNQAIISKPHVWAAFWTALMVYHSCGYASTGRRRSAIWAGISLGLAAGSNMFAAAMVCIPAALLFRRNPTLWLRSLASMLVAATATYLLTNPYVVLNPKLYLASILHHGSGEGWGYAVAELGEGFSCAYDLLVHSFAFPLGLLGAAQAFQFLWSGSDFWKKLAAGWTIAFIALMFLVSVPRILVFLGPLLCLFSGYALDRLFRLPRFARLGPRLLLGILTIGPGLLFAGLFAWDSIEDPDFVILGNFRNNRRMWRSHPLSGSYELTHVLGYRPALDWPTWFRAESLSRVAGWVYARRQEQRPS